MNHFHTLNQLCDIGLIPTISDRLDEALVVKRLQYQGIKARFFRDPNSNTSLGYAINVLGLEGFQRRVLASLYGMWPTTPQVYFKTSYTSEGRAFFDARSAVLSPDFFPWFDNSLPSPKELPSSPRYFQSLGSWPAALSISPDFLIVQTAREYPKALDKFLPKKDQRAAAQTRKVYVRVKHDMGTNIPGVIGPLDAVYDPLLELWIPKVTGLLPIAFKDSLVAARTYQRFRKLDQRKKQNGGSLWNGGALLGVYEAPF